MTQPHFALGHTSIDQPFDLALHYPGSPDVFRGVQQGTRLLWPMISRSTCQKLKTLSACSELASAERCNDGECVSWLMCINFALGPQLLHQNDHIRTGFSHRGRFPKMVIFRKHSLKTGNTTRTRAAELTLRQSICMLYPLQSYIGWVH
jgi:hypothetical protein